MVVVNGEIARDIGAHGFRHKRDCAQDKERTDEPRHNFFLCEHKLPFVARFCEFSAIRNTTNQKRLLESDKTIVSEIYRWGCVSAIDSHGRNIWIADAHRGDGKRFVVHADENAGRLS